MSETMTDCRRLTVVTGTRVDVDAFRQLQARARRVYAANTHIFEDEFDALVAIGGFPLRDALRAEYGALEDVAPMPAA